MKKLALLLLFLTSVTAGFAQFEKDKKYIGASVSGMNLSYSGGEKTNLGLEARVGYMLEDNWMLTAQGGFTHYGGDQPDNILVGVGVRYYIVQNGLFLGAQAKMMHADHNYNDVMPGFEVGYAFFINRNVTIEPAIYYDQSFKNHSDYSKIGFRVGLGIYL